MSKRIGVLTSGGDCQGLNSAIRAVCKSLYQIYDKESLEIYGFLNGYKGLINGNYKILRPQDFSGILNVGGTILGTSRQPFKKMKIIEEDNIDKIKQMKSVYKDLKLDCIVILGGNGTQKTANLLSNEGLNIVSLPKTIDNDIWGTDITFGFHSAVDVATKVIDNIHTTASAHDRIFIVEIMGHKVGWLALYAGIAGGADIILIPEIPYNLNSIAKSIKNREKHGKKFSIIAIAEGAKPGGLVESNKSFDLKKGTSVPISYILADNLQKLLGREIKVSIPGHIQRGGNPCPYDRLIATRFGTAAAELVKNKKYGMMVSLKNNEIVSVPLNEVAGKLKYIPTDSNIIKSAMNLGITFGL